MKKLSIIVAVYAVVGLLLPVALQAQSSQGYVLPENAEVLNPSTPYALGRTVPQSSTEYAVSRLSLNPYTTTAGAPSDPKDEKSIVSPSTAMAQANGFSAPTAYSEFKFTQIQDNRPIGLDGPQYNGIVGFDFSSFWDTIVGFNFTYSNEALDSNFGGTRFTNSNNAFFFSPYVAKNFIDWINVGGSFTYGRTDNNFSFTGPGFGSTQKSTQDTFSYAPFVGAAHTWGAWSFSSTATYIYAYDHFNFDFPVNNPGFATIAPPDAKTLNQSFLWLNNVQYAIDDKWSVSVQANWTRLLTMQNVNTAITPLIPALDHQWMSFGGRVDYKINNDASVFAAYEHDVFDTHFSDYRVRTGLNWNF